MTGGGAAEAGSAPDGRDAEPAVSVESVTVRLGDVIALDSVSFEAHRGRFVGLIGPNGAGKTTTLRAIAGLVRPATGTVCIDGSSVADLSSREASRLVAVVPQETSVAFDFDVREVVRMGRTPYRSRLPWRAPADADAVERALERTGITRLADRSITAVSGGERQRVLLARALAQETPVLLLDEPTASLDIAHQVRTLELLRDLVGGGKTVIAAIHDLNLAAHYADELVLLGDGRRLAAGSPRDVLTEAELERAFGTAAAVTRHPVTGSIYVAAVPDRPSDEPRGRVHVIAGGGSAARLLYLLDAAGYVVSVGALNRGDTDLETARALGLESVSVDPLAPVDAGARDRVERLVGAADVTVLADIEVGAGNLPNLEAARAARSVVIVEDRPFEERDLVGEPGRSVYEALRARARLVGPEDVLTAVGRAIDDGRDVGRSG